MIVMKNLEAVYYTEIEPEIITLKSDKRYYVQGYISTIDKDLVNDVLTIEAQKDLHNQIQGVITKGGFITGDIEHMVFYDEKGNQLNFPKVRDEKGNLIIPELKFVQSELREKGVWVKAEVNKHLPNFKTIWKSIEDGFLNGFSVAVNALETVTKRVNNEMVNYISRLKLLNITMTGTPCNQNALMQPVLKSLINGEDMKLKHKYIRREGKPGDYTYFYKEDDGKETSSKDEPDEDTKKEISKQDRREKEERGKDKIMSAANKQQLMLIYDMDNLEQRQLANFVANKENPTKKDIDEGLKIIVNTVEGDRSQLSDALQEYAQGQGWFKGFDEEESGKEEISEVKDYGANKVKINDKVTIHPNLTKDPKNKQGKSGVISKIIDSDTIEVTFEDGAKGKYDRLSVVKADSKDGFKEYTKKKSINTNLKKLEGGKMADEQKLFSKPEEEVNDVEETETETETTETEEPKENVELKSALVSLKSEIERINTDNLALKTELKAVTERLQKIEEQPIKKSLAADKSKMLGVTETSNLREINALDLI